MMARHSVLLAALALAFAALGGPASSLPDRVDNSTSPYFPPIIRQTHESCAQEAGISTLLTYEWNRLHGTRAAFPENQFAGKFLWNFLNRGENRGAELAEGWHLARSLGVPTVAVYRNHVGPDDALGAWPHGYALYREAMQHRIRAYRFSPLATVADLTRAKRWLFEHGDAGRSPGGLLAIEGRLSGFRQVPIPAGQFEAGKAIVLRWGRRGAGHVMTYVGYDDRVGYDLNGDGRLTNDQDLNDDGVIGLADWERGAFIAANSYGREWGDGGKTYVLYRESAVTPFRRGRWMASISVWPAYQPRLTLRLRLQTNCQTAVRLRLAADGQAPFAPALFDGDTGIAGHADLPGKAVGPEKYSRFLSGSPRLSRGPARQDPGGGTLPVELGLDLTGRLPFDAAEYTLEFQLDRARYPQARGTVWEAHLRRYAADGTLLEEIPFADLPSEMGGTRRRVRLPVP